MVESKIPTSIYFKKRKNRLNSKFFLFLALFIIFGAGIGMRLINFTNPPLDFQAWRQLRSASIARGMYYEMDPSADPKSRELAVEIANQFDIMEPTVFERLVAATYLLLGGEYLFIPRLYAILFWTIGGIGIFLISRQITTVYGGLVSLFFYFLMPFGVTASRVFMPDPLMVMWIILAAYALLRWSEVQSWKWTILAGIFSGIAVYIKVFAVFPIISLSVLLTLSKFSLRQALTNRKVWGLVGAMVLLPAIYYFGIMGGHASNYINDWVLGFNNLLIQFSFYRQWLTMLSFLFNKYIVILSLLSFFFFPHKSKIFVLALWLGYFLIGCFVPSLIITHTYYSLYAIPVISISLAGLASFVFSSISRQPVKIASLCTLFVLGGIFFTTNGIYSPLRVKDYHQEILGWEKMKDELPKDSVIIGLTHDYNTRVMYYAWTPLRKWPYIADMEMNVLSGGNLNLNDPYWQKYFDESIKDADYFLVTLMNELEGQPILKQNLYKYAHTEGDGYILFDLHKKN